ncbi:GIY-YIG nuclease family protein [Lactobacillus sp. DCY120]|uniref:GIY-YIG nuclease family protein n=1 Tax=Bombilactobacillus apium TaxID=2675299 RepID=A0A850R3S7_9LACO|nr:GIY-YIG nuclease family protein [Bombilactobacillus apium]NVY97020.1 GIY-YIG nuclease family protein [Bombilactobacillus apium]
MSLQNNYSVYIVECADRTLYTGISNNVSARIKTHNLGKGAKYTRVRRPVQLRYQEFVGTRSQAQKREAEIKHYSRQEKFRLITQKRGN